MEIPKKRPKTLQYIIRSIMTVVILAVLLIVWMQLSTISEAKSVSSDDLIIAAIERGDLVRQVRAAGTLVPIDQHYISATSNGRVKQTLLEAGAVVEVGTTIMTLENRELNQAVDAAKYELNVLEADYLALKQRLHQEYLRQKISVADFKARYEMAKLRSEANQRLSKTGAVSSIDYNESTLLEEQLKNQHALEVERLQSLPALTEAELAAAQAKVNKARRQLHLQEELADDLNVKASIAGVLQEIPLEDGEQFTTGMVLARIAVQDELKTQLRVQESEVKEVSIGQKALISADGHSAWGEVKRIDPAVQQGVVLVDVYFTGTMLHGGRPDLRVDGVIELEQIKDVLKVKRPVFSQEFSSKPIFVLNDEEKRAYRQIVEFGSASVEYIEVRSNLNEGDRIIISDTNKYSDVSELALN